MKCVSHEWKCQDWFTLWSNDKKHDKAEYHQTCDWQSWLNAALKTVN